MRDLGERMGEDGGRPRDGPGPERQRKASARLSMLRGLAGPVEPSVQVRRRAAGDDMLSGVAAAPATLARRDRRAVAVADAPLRARHRPPRAWVPGGCAPPSRM